MSIFAAAKKRRGTPADLLVVGLGNPGKDYERTRHNVGVEVIEELARRKGGKFSMSSKERALVSEVRFGEKRIVLAFPQTFMNLSGESVAPLVRRHGVIEVTRVMVVHDELDLDVGRMKLKAGGGLAGHNGLRSIKQHLQSGDFLRLRLGVGKPPHSGAGKNYVLRVPPKSERTELDIMIQEAADAIELLVAEGLQPAMNRYNST